MSSELCETANWEEQPAGYILLRSSALRSKDAFGRDELQGAVVGFWRRAEISGIADLFTQAELVRQESDGRGLTEGRNCERQFLPACQRRRSSQAQSFCKCSRPGAGESPSIAPQKLRR